FAANQVSYSISGQVAANGGGLPGATVTAGNVSAQTAADGSYSLAGLPAGTYNVSASKQGYNVNGPLNVTVGPSQNGVNFAGQAAAGAAGGPLTLNPAATVGGSAVTGTVTLSAPAGAGGVSVPLSSDNAAAVVPVSVVVPQG